MEETFCKKIRKYCRLTNRYADIREPIVRMQSSGNPEGEITVSLPESCSYAGKCYTEDKDCYWAKGELFSTNNPLIDNP